VSNKKKRNKRRHRGASSSSGAWVGEEFFDGDADCCILCTLYRQAEAQDDSWSLSDRADELVARMRAAQTWGGGFTPLIRSPREQVDRFACEWLEPRADDGEPTEGMQVAVTAFGRFWDSYHRPVPA